MGICGIWASAGLPRWCLQAQCTSPWGHFGGCLPQSELKGFVFPQASASKERELLRCAPDPARASGISGAKAPAGGGHTEPAAGGCAVARRSSRWALMPAEHVQVWAWSGFKPVKA